DVPEGGAVYIGVQRFGPPSKRLASVSSPRRNTARDVGWFAPVATRRRLFHLDPGRAAPPPLPSAGRRSRPGKPRVERRRSRRPRSRRARPVLPQGVPGPSPLGPGVEQPEGAHTRPAQDLAGLRRAPGLPRRLPRRPRVPPGDRPLRRVRGLT